MFCCRRNWRQFQITTGNGILAANSEWIFSIQNTFLFILKFEMVWTDLINHMYIRNSKMVKKE